MDKRTRALVLKDFSGRVGSGPGEKKTVEGAGKKKKQKKKNKNKKPLLL